MVTPLSKFRKTGKAADVLTTAVLGEHSDPMWSGLFLTDGRRIACNNGIAVFLPCKGTIKLYKLF